MTMDNLALFEAMDEQTAVRFTGRLNVLDRLSRQLIGVVIVKEGEVLRCDYRGAFGLKAFYNMAIESAQLVLQDFVVEPEIIADDAREIFYPYPVLKARALEAIQQYMQYSAQRPPGHLRLMVRSDFISAKTDPVTDSEFQVLCSITEWGKVEDLYRNCPLQDYEITKALVQLRKKEAIKTLGVRTPGQ